TPRAEDQKGELGAVGAERAAEAVEDLAFAGEHQSGTPGCHAGRAHFLGDGRALLPELDDRRVDLVDPGAQLRDVRLRTFGGPGTRGLAQHRAAHFSAPSGRWGPHRPGAAKRPGLVSPGRSQVFVIRRDLRLPDSRSRSRKIAP